MDKERKPCNRATCGNKMKCAHVNKEMKRSPQDPCRPGAESARNAPKITGDSTQILYVEPNFTETPSEYDVFYDCFSDVEISQPDAVVCSKSRSIAPPVVKDSRMFRDALKQVIVTAQMLLVEFESSSRKERKGCGSRCRCDVRNIKPQSRTVQLEVTAKVAANKTNTSPNIHIDPITFTIPLKLRLQGQNQPNIPYADSQQSYETRRPMTINEREHISKLFSSMEPIRTATVTAARPEVSSIPMEGPRQQFNLQSSFWQQMTGLQPGFVPFPFEAAGSLPMQAPPDRVVSSRVQIQIPPSPTLMTLGRPDADTVSKMKGNCGGLCKIERQPAPSTEPFLSPSLAPVTRGPFLATIATSSVPSLGTTKSQQLSESASQGVCVLCGRGGEHSHMQTELSNKTPCGMCSKGKSIPPQISEFPSQPQEKGECGKCVKERISLVVIVPPMPKLVRPDTNLAMKISDGERGTSKGACNVSTLGVTPSLSKQNEPLGKSSCTISRKGASGPLPNERDISQQKVSQPSSKGPCGMCTKRPPPPPPLQEPLLIVKGPCGMCSKPEPQSLIPEDMHGKAEKSPSEVCSKGSVAPSMTDKGPCRVCSRGVEAPVKAVKAPCGICSKRPAALPMTDKAPCRGADAPVKAEQAPSGICSKGAAAPPMVDKVPCSICSKGVDAPVKAEKAPCGIFPKEDAAPAITDKAPCSICSRGVAAPVKPEKAPCGIFPKEDVTPAITDKVPCSICSRGVAAPVKPEKSPCGICSKGAAAPAITDKAPCSVCSRGTAEPSMTDIAPCRVSSRAAVSPMEDEKRPCGVCSSRAAPIELGERTAPSTKVKKSGPCGICSRGAAVQLKSEVGSCGICSKSVPKALEAEMGPCGICSRRATKALETEIGPCGICSRGGAAQSKSDVGSCGICSKSPAKTVETEERPCGICSRGTAAPLEIEFGPCGICSRGTAATSKSEVGPCGICSRGAAAPLETEFGPCGICTRGAPPAVNVKKGPCGICSIGNTAPVQTSNREEEVIGPCNICKKEPPPSATNEARGLCGICKKARAPEESQIKGPCGICSKPTSPGLEPFKIQPCGKCSSVGTPCNICGHNVTENLPSQTEGPCGNCKAPAVVSSSVQPANIRQCGTCIPPPKPTTCGTCLVTSPTVSDHTCGTCLLPKPTEKPIVPIKPLPKYFKALPQHKDIHICSPCRYDPSPLIDVEGNVFCPHNCGCCLCPWRKRATDSQIDQIKHEKIKVCKCRMKGSIFADYTSRAKCSNTSYFDCCPCRERAEAKYLEMTGEEMWRSDDRMGERVRGDPVNLEDVAEYQRASTTL